MARMSTCKKCEKKITKEERVTHSGKSYCLDCHEILMLETKEYETLISTICEYFNTDSPSGLILKQIKQYKDEFNYTNGGITYTLWYIKEIECKNFEPKYGIARVKYYYDKARLYFEQQSRILNSVNKEKFEVKTKIIKISAKKINNDETKFTFDIDKLIGGE